jgi:hypothetical protein
VDGWSSEEQDDIIVGRRRMRVGRRRIPVSRLRWPIIGIIGLVVLAGAVYGITAAPPGARGAAEPAIATPAVPRLHGSGNTITVGLQVRNVANVGH